MLRQDNTYYCGLGSTTCWYSTFKICKKYPIQKIVHKIITSFGDSRINCGGEYLGCWKNYPQGVLHSNDSGPTIWSLLRSIIFEVLHKRGFVAKLCTSPSRQVFKLVGFVYLDDCDLIQSCKDPPGVLRSIHNLINSWWSLMDIAGGSLSI